MIFLLDSYDISMRLLWNLNGFLWYFYDISRGFFLGILCVISMGFPWWLVGISLGFQRDIYGISIGFLSDFYGTSKISMGFPSYFYWISIGFL